MIALRRSARPVALLALEGATVAALSALGTRSPFSGPRHGVGPWLHVAAPADVLVAVLRWVALAGAGWLFLGTLLYVGASLTRIPGAVRAVRWATLPAVRRAVDAALVASLVTGSLVAPAAAHAADPASGHPPATAVRDGHAGGLASLPPAVPPTTATTVVVTPGAVTVAPAPVPAPVPEASTVVTVAPGDNLWELAAWRYAATTGRPRADVADAEIAPYWLTVCDRNRATLASGDTNLIRPGEQVVLPPVA
jgi:hypothetical protein